MSSDTHPGIVCDRSGMNPIVGIRYQLRGENYDLCEAEYEKLSDDEKQTFVAIQPPGLNNNDTLIADLQRRDVLRTPEYIDAFRQVKRAHFLPEDMPQDVIYKDTPIRQGIIPRLVAETGQSVPTTRERRDRLLLSSCRERTKGGVREALFCSAVMVRR